MSDTDAPAEGPRTSTAREALTAAAAAEDILATAVDPYAVSTYIGTIVDSARTLRPDQAADLTAHIRYRAERLQDYRDRLEPIEGHVAEIQGDGLREQVDELAEVIMHEIEGEPSRSEGAVECAIRLLRDAYAADPDEDPEDRTERARARVDELAGRVRDG